MYNFQDILKAKENGSDINIKYHDNLPLAICHYGIHCQLNSLYDKYELFCRGTVFDIETGELIAWPFEKFFNYGERGRFPEENTYPINVYEKVDGSLIVAFWYKNQWICTTKGSFSSWQGKEAQEIFNNKAFLDNFPKHMTHMFEYIGYKNQVVLHYDERGALVYLNSRDLKTGNLQRTSNVALSFETIFTTFKYNTEQILGLLKHMKFQEGFVVEYSDGSLWKFKTDWYLKLHKVVSKFDKFTVLEAYVKGELDDFELGGYKKELLDSWVEKLEKQVNYIKEILFSLESTVKLTETLEHHYIQDNKQLVDKINELGYSDYKDLIFKFRFGKHTEKDIYIAALRDLGDNKTN